MNTTELKAGRELDALVAEKVMGFKVKMCEKAWAFMDWISSDYPTEENCLAIPNEKFKPGDSSPPAVYIPEYSTSYDDAFEVVEKLRGGKKYKNFIGMETCCNEEKNLFWVCNVVMKDYPNMPITEAADTLPLAICRAALAVVENERG